MQRDTDSQLSWGKETVSVEAGSATSFQASAKETATSEKMVETQVAQSNKQQVAVQNYNQTVDAIKPYAEALIAASAKVTAKKVAEIAGVVWDEFKKMSRLQQILAILATALVVGAVGYVSWKLIRGNWATITGFVYAQAEKLQAKKDEIATMIGQTAVVAKIGEMFQKKQEKVDLSKENVKGVLQLFQECGHAGAIAAFVESLKAAQA